ncbi:MAG: amidohydrolase family protein [Phycisphaerae bacterium]|nr:amidohydrolase family protein [Phycisphaerae bacterium]
MSEIIDFHAHAFPDAVADSAMAKLQAEVPHVPCYLDGKIDSLLYSMDDAGVETSVLCCIATRPKQYESILSWCRQIRSDRIVPFPSVHPADPEAVERIGQIAAEGFKGIKMHPYYQEYILDEPRLMPLYDRMCREGLILVVHTGFDIAFERIDRGGPERILRVTEVFPELKLVTTHLGAWEQWDRVEEILIGRKMYMDISYAIDFLGKDKARDLIVRHPADRVLFGTDSPWDDQRRCVQIVRDMNLGTERESLLLGGNARRLLAG